MMRIGAREIGPGHPPYVIAEIGVNHDGEAARALELVDAAAEAGADAVKLQYFRAGLLMSARAAPAAYQRAAGEHDAPAMLRRLELSAEDLAPVVFRAHQRGIHAVLTVFSTELVAEAARMNWDAWKTASPDITHRRLLCALAETGRPLIVSTGASTMEEVRRAQGWLGGREAAFLHCVSAYPVSEDDASVGAVGELARATGRPAGYSDHTARIETGAVAVAAGACILEKHLTHRRGAAGPDHAASLEPAQMAEYVRLAHLAHRLLGDGVKRPLAVEADVRAASRQSVTARRRVPRGKMIEASDLCVKRPGSGLPAFMLDEVAGRIAARDIEADAPISAEDLA